MHCRFVGIVREPHSSQDVTMAIFDLRKLRAAKFLRKRYLVPAVIISGVLGIGGHFWWRFRVIGTLVPFLSTGDSISGGEIILRTTSPESDFLLISQVTSGDVARSELDNADLKPTGPVYRFTPGVPRLQPGTLDEWAKATGVITYRYSDRDTTIAPLDFLGKSLSIRGTHLSTAGGYNLDIDVSPDRRFVNVVSANAPRSKGSFFWAFGGGGGYPLGRCYHEVFERQTGAKIGKTYTLDYAGNGARPSSYCWEAQGKYVVYYDTYGRFLWIVPGPKPPPDPPPPDVSPVQRRQKKSDG